MLVVIRCIRTPRVLSRPSFGRSFQLGLGRLHYLASPHICTDGQPHRRLISLKQTLVRSELIVLEKRLSLTLRQDPLLGIAIAPALLLVSARRGLLERGSGLAEGAHFGVSCDLGLHLTGDRRARDGCKVRLGAVGSARHHV